MPVPDEVREAVCGEIEEALRGISVCEDGDGYNYGILDAIAEARGEYELSGAGDVLRDASADIFDAALSALEAAGWEVNRKGTREALEHTRTSLGHAIDIIRRNVDRDALGTNSDGDADVPGGYRSWPLLDEYLHYMDESMTKCAALLTASNPKEQAP